MRYKSNTRHEDLLCWRHSSVAFSQLFCGMFQGTALHLMVLKQIIHTGDWPVQPDSTGNIITLHLLCSNQQSATQTVVRTMVVLKGTPMHIHNSLLCNRDVMYSSVSDEAVTCHCALPSPTSISCLQATTCI